MSNLNEMTRSDFESLPSRGWNEDIGLFDSMVIVPCQLRWYDILKYNFVQLLKRKISWFDSWYVPDGLHDSGYRCMDFIACREGDPICRLSGCSDVIHLNGIGGDRGYKDADWSIDCLKKSGFLHIFTHNAEFSAGAALSSFDLIAKRKRDKNE